MTQGDVVVAGLPGSGKTVLLSALSIQHDDILIPKNQQTMDFADKAFCLQEGRWPAPTNPLSVKSAIRWEVCRNGKRIPLVAYDVAGEEWTSFIAENQDATGGSAGKEGNQNVIAKILKDASAICLLIDLTEDINIGRNAAQRNFVVGVMNYLEKINRKNRSIALVVTKCNTYGNRSEWEQVLEKNYISLMKRQWKPGRYCVIYTDAVADTVIRNDELVPAEGFSSIGLKKLLNWICDIAEETNRPLASKIWIKIRNGFHKTKKSRRKQ